MGTVSLVVSFGVAAMLYGRDTIEDSASLAFLLGSMTILALGGFPVWLMLLLPLFPAWFEAVFRFPKRCKRSGLWLVFMLLPGIALTIIQYSGIYHIPSWVFCSQAGMMLCLELMVHCLPVYLSDDERMSRVLNIPYLYSFLASIAGQYAWFRVHEQWVFILLCCSVPYGIHHGLRALLHHKASLLWQRRLDKEPQLSFIAAICIWGMILNHLL